MSGDDKMADPRARCGQKLIQLLAGTDFAARYFAFCDERAGREADPSLTREDYEKALAETGLAFKYGRRERFFGHRETVRGTAFYFNAIVRHDLELVFNFDTPYGVAGRPFHGLAAAVQTLRDPNWRHEPAYPRLPFTTLADFREAIAFGIGLYQELRALVLENTWV